MKTYSVKYQLGDTSVGRAHEKLEDAVKDLKSCMHVSWSASDKQEIGLVVNDDDKGVVDGPLSSDEWDRVQHLLGVFDVAMTKTKTHRAPGAGRKPLPAGERRVSRSLSLLRSTLTTIEAEAVRQGIPAGRVVDGLVAAKI